jgi:hypothetical protein
MYLNLAEPWMRRISAAKVLTVVKQPQYPSDSPCRREQALLEMGSVDKRWITPKAHNTAVPKIFAMKVPTGKLAFDLLNWMAKAYRVKAPGGANKRAAVALCR